MMEGGAFILLKACRRQPGNAEQAKILLAGLPKILRIAGFGSDPPPRLEGKQRAIVVLATIFRGIWLICQNRRFCYLDHSFTTEIDAICCNRLQEKDGLSICYEIYTSNYFKMADSHPKIP
jgi:hypothetical protein